MNLKESLELLLRAGKDLEAAQQAHQPIPGLSNARQFAFLHWEDGSISFESKMRQAFRPEAINLASFIKVAQSYGLQSVWVSPDRLVAHSNEVVNGLDEFDHATWLTLEHTHLFTALKRLAGNGYVMNQSELIKKLRTTFSQTLKEPTAGAAELLAAVRKLKFHKNESGSSVVNQGQEAVGRSVEAAVAGVQGTIPELFNVSVVPYKNLGSAGKIAQVPVYVDILVEDRAFNLYTLEEDIEAAESAQMDTLVQILKAELKDDFTVLCGNPVADCCLTEDR